MWDQLGFSKSPYFWEELSVSEQGYALFVGRNEEGRRFIINLSEPDGCVVVVEGLSGIGKTSFINFNQYVLYRSIEDAYPALTFKKPHLLPSLRKIQLRDGEPIESIYLKILSGCIFSIQHVCKEKGQPFPNELADIRDYVTQVISHTKDGALGFSILGSGANVARGSSKTINESKHFREMTFLEFLDQISEVARKKLGFDGVLIAINNLDIVSREYLTQSLNFLRDSLFCRPYYWWVLISPVGLHHYIRQNVPRLTGVLSGKPIVLAPLTSDEVEDLLRARLKYLWVGKGEPAPPVSMRILRFLYERSSGDIRFAFQVANEVVKRVFYDYPSITEIDEELAAREVARITVDEIRMENFTQLEHKIVRLVILSPDLKEIDPRSEKFLSFSSVKQFEEALETLVQKRWLTRMPSIDGGGVMYAPRGYASLAQTFRVKDYPSIIPES